MSGRRQQAIWHGTHQESQALLDVIAHHCACQRDTAGVLRGSCAAHAMLGRDQRALDGLVFARRISARLRDEEGLAERRPRPARHSWADTPTGSTTLPVRRTAGGIYLDPHARHDRRRRGQVWLSRALEAAAWACLGLSTLAISALMGWLAMAGLTLLIDGLRVVSNWIGRIGL